MNLLFVCSKNQWRSPTAERVFRGYPGVSTRSAGTASSARHQVTVADLQWADVVVVMEQKHLTRLRADFPRTMEYQDCWVLDVPDEFRFMDPELVEILTEAVEPILGDREEGRG